jgi:hypothetical protein
MSGWSSQVVIASQVIIQGAADGLFVYNGAPALGNLIVSAAAQAGTDPYGNTYPQGLQVTVGVISGTTFSGTDFVINTAGAFFYSAAPAAGNLIASITNVAGTDPFGNQYLLGFTTFDRGNSIFANMQGGLSQWGPLQAGQPATNDSGSIQSTSISLIIDAPITSTGGFLSPGQMQLSSGQTGQTTGAANTPQLQLQDSSLSSPFDVRMTGSLIKTQLATLAPYTAQTPTLAAGYTNDNLKYRQMPFDAVWWDGEISQTTGVGAAGAATVFTLAAPYIPKREQVLPASWRNSGGLSKGGNAFFAFETNGNVMLGWSGATANGDRFSCDVMVDLGNVP